MLIAKNQNAISNRSIINILFLLLFQTRDMAEIIGKVLMIKDVPVSISHAGLTYKERKEAVEKLRNGNCTVAVATNVLARGIDIPNVRAIMNYELPFLPQLNTADTMRYLYRMGRGSRFGNVQHKYANSIHAAMS